MLGWRLANYASLRLPITTDFNYLTILFLFLPSFPLRAQEQQVIVPYTLADRDRAILPEAKVNSLDTKMEVKFESQQRKLDDIKKLFYGGFGILTTLFLFMFGYIVGDRRTAMKPALI